MTDKQREACGRCSMSAVVGAVADEEEAASAERDPFGENRIEIDDDQLRQVSPSAWMGRLTTRLNEMAQKLTYRR